VFCYEWQDLTTNARRGILALREQADGMTRLLLFLCFAGRMLGATGGFGLGPMLANVSGTDVLLM
jgi:hypothetical protein